MKAPGRIKELSLADKAIGVSGTYPPLGFLPVFDAELGNGDYYGLYWPYGREDREPIVCDMVHDEWSLQIAFSSVPIFVNWLELNDHERGEAEVDDPQHAPTRFAALRPLLRDQPNEAISDLRSICDDFPECSEYWYTLATQLRRVGDHASSHAAAVRAYASNWAFGAPPQGTLRMLQTSKVETKDPLTMRSRELFEKFGGTKENSNYPILKECIEEYLASDMPLLGLLLNQNYGYTMSMETVSFRERYQFEPKQWITEHSELCAKYLGDSRTSVT